MVVTDTSEYQSGPLWLKTKTKYQYIPYPKVAAMYVEWSAEDHQTSLMNTVFWGVVGVATLAGPVEIAAIALVVQTGKILFDVYNAIVKDVAALTAIKNKTGLVVLETEFTSNNANYSSGHSAYTREWVEYPIVTLNGGKMIECPIVAPYWGF